MKTIHKLTPLPSQLPLDHFRHHHDLWQHEPGEDMGLYRCMRDNFQSTCSRGHLGLWFRSARPRRDRAAADGEVLVQQEPSASRKHALGATTAESSSDLIVAAVQLHRSLRHLSRGRINNWSLFGHSTGIRIKCWLPSEVFHGSVHSTRSEDPDHRKAILQ